jgi:hypothetical protein
VAAGWGPQLKRNPLAGKRNSRMRRHLQHPHPAHVAVPLAGLLFAIACAANPKPSTAPPAVPPQPGAAPPGLTFRLVWAGPADLDLHVLTPLREEIWFTQPKSASGGVLDTDCNVKPEEPCPHPNEAVSWPASDAPVGGYFYWVRLMHPREAELPVAFTVIVSQDGKPLAEQHGQLREPGEISHKWGLVYEHPH